MKVIGIIAEYDPLHNGHGYQLEYARNVLGADVVVVVMSGFFTQRGRAAVFDKMVRAGMALKAGADIVLELPVVYSTASAGYFGAGAVGVLESLGFVNGICFGSETDDLSLLMKLERHLEEAEGAPVFKELLKNGRSYPAARMETVIDLHPEFSPEEQDFINKPNAMLGLSYLKALRLKASSMIPHVLLREGDGYHQCELTGTCGNEAAVPDRDKFESSAYLQDKVHENAAAGSDIFISRNNGDNDIRPSAKALRGYIREKNDKAGADHLKRYIPDASLEYLINSGYPSNIHPGMNAYSELLMHAIMLRGERGFEDYFEIGENFSNRIIKVFKEMLQSGRISGDMPGKSDLPENFYSAFAERLKTRDMTMARIYRDLLHILLDIGREEFEAVYREIPIPYIRLLAFRNEPRVTGLLKASKTQIIRNPASILRDRSLISSYSQTAGIMLEKDVLAADLFRLGMMKAGNYNSALDEYHSGTVIM